MATFLDDISVYNAKASLAIAEAVTAGNTDRANMMSSLKTTANDTTLTEAVRLNALTALINLGGLLDIPLPPFFPLTVTYANTQTYVGIHDDLTGLQGGAPGDYQHITTQQLNDFLGKASLNDITFANIQGIYSENGSLQAAIDGKQNELNGVGFVKINGNQSTIYYDNTTYLTSTSLASTALTGELSGTIGNPTVNNAAVIAKVLTGWNGSAAYSAITSSDTILSGMEKLNARISGLISNPIGVASLTASTNAPAVLNVAASSPTGNVTFSVDFDSQAQNRVMASPNGSSGVPGFRSLVTNDLPSSGVTPGTYGSASLIPIITVDAKGRVTFVVSAAAAAGGQVNTVALTGPGIFNNFTSTGTTNVTLGFGLVNQSANRVWAGPSTGVNAAPQFRLLVEDDIPTLSTSKINGLTNLLALKLDAKLNDGEIWIGNNSNAPTNRSLTQDIEMTNTGVVTIQPNVVDFSKMQQITGYDSITAQPGNLLGRYAAGTGNVQEVNLNASHFLLDDTTGTLSLATPPTPVLNTKGSLITFSQSIGQAVELSAVFDGYLLITDSNEDYGLKWVQAQGDIEVDVALDGTFNITPGAVTLAKMADLPAYRVIGNDTAGPLAPKALTKAELTTLVNQFTSSLAGIVPASGGGSTNFLRADGSWASPSGGGTTTNALTNGTGILAFSFDGGTPGITVDIDNMVVATLTDTQALTNKTLSTGFVIDVSTPDTGTIWYSSDNSGTVAPLTAAGNGGKYLSINSISGLPEWTGVVASSATNLSGGTANQIPYQTGASTTSFITAPTTADTFLKWNGSAFVWATAGSGSGTVNSGGLKELAYYDAAGTAVSGLPVSGTNGTFFLSQVITAGVPANPVWTGVTGTGLVVLDDTPTIKQPRIGDGAGNGHLHIRRGNTPGGLANYATLAFLSASKTMSIEFDADNFQSQFLFAATTSTKTYTFPDSSGTVTLLGNTTTGSGSIVLATSPTLTTPSIGAATGTSIDVTGALTSGVASTTAGTLVLRNAASSATQTIRGTNPTTSVTYDLPTTAPTANQVLQASAPSSGIVTLSWASNGGSLPSKYFSNFTATTVTNPTGNTKIESILIPANTFGGSQAFLVSYRINSTTSTTSVNILLGINTTDSVSGVIQLNTSQTVNAGVANLISFLPVWINPGSPLTTRTILGLSNTTTYAATSTTIDWTVDQYIILYCGASATRTVTNTGITITPLIF